MDWENIGLEKYPYTLTSQMCGAPQQHLPHTSCAWLCEHWGNCPASGRPASEPGPAVWAPWCQCSPYWLDSPMAGPASECTERKHSMTVEISLAIKKHLCAWLEIPVCLNVAIWYKWSTCSKEEVSTTAVIFKKASCYSIKISVYGPL